MIKHKLEPGYALTVTPETGARVIVTCLEDSEQSAPLRSARTFGPFIVSRTFEVSGAASVSSAVGALSASLASLLLMSDGAPDDAAQSAANVNPTGDDNGLTFTAREYGAGGDQISVAYVDPSANSQSLSVSVAGKSIVVLLATNGGGTITSTAAQVKAGVEASSAASELVTVAIMTSDTGTGDDGSGVVTAMASTSLASGAGTGIGVALPGAICIDTTNGDVYRNSGTRAVPAWTQLADVA
ncbi:MAG: B-type flagellin [Pseudomonadota bacterium]